MNLIPFFFEQHSVRVILRNSDPWFVAADVCDALALGNNREAVGRLDDDEKGVSSVDTLGGPQELGVINESGLYSLILTSRKPEAKRFKKWVTADVLPSIRKTGGYAVFSAPQTLPEALRLAADLAEQRNEAQAKLAIAAPKALAFEKIKDAAGLVCFRDACKLLGKKEKTVKAWLLSHDWAYTRPPKNRMVGRSVKVALGFLDHKMTSRTFDDGTVEEYTQMMFTPRGVARLAQIFAHVGYPQMALDGVDQ